eukprot:EG_transcript_15222
MQEVAIVCHDEDATVFVDLKSQAQLYRQKHNACSGGAGCAFSPQHNVLFAAQHNKDAVHLYWPLKDAPRLHHTSERVACLALSPDSVYLAAGTQQGRVFLWHLNSGNMLRLFSAHYRAVQQLLFLPDSSFLVTASADSAVKSWNLVDVLDVTRQNATPPCHKAIPDHHLAVTGLQGCARPGWVVSCSLDMTVKVLDVLDGTVLFTQALPCALHCLAVNKLTTLAFAGGSDGTIYGVPLYRAWGGGWTAAATPAFLPQRSDGPADGPMRFEGHRGRIRGLSVTANERCLLSGSEDGNVHMWDIASGQLVRTIFETKGPVTALLVVLLPTVLPTEKSLALHHPLGPTLRKFPMTDFSGFTVSIPTAKVKARLALLDKEKTSMKE